MKQFTFLNSSREAQTTAIFMSLWAFLLPFIAGDTAQSTILHFIRILLIVLGVVYLIAYVRLAAREATANHQRMDAYKVAPHDVQSITQLDFSQLVSQDVVRRQNSLSQYLFFGLFIVTCLAAVIGWYLAFHPGGTWQPGIWTFLNVILLSAVAISALVELARSGNTATPKKIREAYAAFAATNQLLYEQPLEPETRDLLTSVLSAETHNRLVGLFALSGVFQNVAWHFVSYSVASRLYPGTNTYRGAIIVHCPSLTEQTQSAIRQHLPNVEEIRITGDWLLVRLPGGIPTTREDTQAFFEGLGLILADHNS